MSALTFSEIEAEIIAEARRGDAGAGDAWLALYDAAHADDGTGDLAARAAKRLQQRKNNEYKSRRAIWSPVAVGPRDGITKSDAMPDIRRPVAVDDDKRVWTRSMIIAAGLAGTRIKAPDAFDDDDTDAEAARLDAAVEAAKLEVKPRDRVILACLVDDKLSVSQTARRVGKTDQAIYASIKRMRPVIARHMRQVAIGGAA
jgi:hypothetical protein